jgi:hypothetical protein
MQMRILSRKLFYVCAVVLLLLSVDFKLAPVRVKAQNDQWSSPQTIPGYPLDTWPPILVADQNRAVHAFSSQWIKDADGKQIRAIVYNMWTIENGWTTPVDILTAPMNEARLTDVYLDGNGIFHLVFFGGNDISADIYYSKAPAFAADDPRAWSPPIIIGENAGDPEGAVITENDQGNLFVIYNGRQLGKGLYDVYSKDGGETWSDSSSFFVTKDNEPVITQLEVIRSKSGWLHAVWGVFDEKARGRGIYYANSKDGNAWSEPVLLASAEEGFGTQTPAIIEYDDQLIILYNQFLKIMMQRSSDGGKTWDNPSIIFPRQIGVNGSLSLVIDSGNILHLFFGQRISGQPDIHGMWHSTYSKGRWQEPESVVKGPLVDDKVGRNSFDPFEARAVAMQGNTLLLTWRTESTRIPNGVWYSYEGVDSPELPIVPLPTFVNSMINTDTMAGFSTKVVTEDLTPSTPTTIADQAIQVPKDKPILPSDSSVGILAGVISAGFLVFIFAIIYRSARKK